ncbi:MAG: hypothetical protein C0618_05670 [Desulfuromonas sp.]|nr:MAG: hypothetical protein C0618_05670 [Desulfuromonas sp.]
MGTTQPYLMLYAIQEHEGWDTHLECGAKKLGYRWQARGRVWQDSQRKPAKNKFEYADGFKTSLIRLAHKKHAIAITSHRYYFEASSKWPTEIPSWRLFPNGEMPSPLAPSKVISSIKAFHGALTRDDNFLAPEPIDLIVSKSNLTNGTKRIFGKDLREFPLNLSPGTNLSRVGPERNPDNFKLLLCCFSDDPRTLEIYSYHLKDAFRRMNVYLNLKIIHPKEIQYEINNGSSPVVLFGVNGKKGERLRAEEASFLDGLDAQRIPYRLFSLDNSALKWSAFDQAGILLESAGGSAYSVRLPAINSKHPLVFIGLDLGHPKHRKHSWLVATLVNEKGHLIGYWRGKQVRDETIREKSLVDALNWCYLTLRKNFAGNYLPLILRDGRMFQHEKLEVYEPFFNNGFSFVEVIKHPVPLMITGESCAQEGSFCKPKGSDYDFIVTSRSRNQSQINLPLKTRLVHDGLSLGKEVVSDLIVGLCYAPTLGLSPTRSPAPIYWSNGLAAIGETNHQFSGLHHVPHN